MTFLSLAAVFGAGCVAEGETGGSHDEPLVFFDAHTHRVPQSTDAALVELSQDAGLSGIIVLGPGDTGSIQSDHPDYATSFASIKLAKSSPEELVPQLEAGARGIGEIAVRHFAAGPGAEPDEFEADGAEMLEVYDLAEAYQVPLNIHFDYSEQHIHEFDTALGLYPDVTFVWAHAGDAQPAQIAALMAAHDNLWIDISSRNSLYDRHIFSKQDQSISGEDDGHSLDVEWRDLFAAYPGRAVFGTDIGPPGRDEQIDEVIEFYRSALSELDPGLAADIAHGNAERLLGLD